MDVCDIEDCGSEVTSKEGKTVNFSNNGKLSSQVFLCNDHWKQVIEKMPVEYLEVLMDAAPSFRKLEDLSIEEELAALFGE